MVRATLLGFLLLFAPPLMAAKNDLAEHPSPYIAMHADDPVKWRLWDESLLAQARRENRLIFISSGYFACHWCHVMQRESFQDPAIATRLNRDTIPVKIDRELWPELDAYLIEFVEKTRGQAGWPLNVFITPQGHPLVGATYLPPAQFEQFLTRLQRRWQESSGQLTAMARDAAMSEQHSADQTGEPLALSRAFRRSLMEAWREQADMLAGGLGQESKFPEVPLLTALLSLRQAPPEVAEFIELTLEQMATQGLRDHLGGGFFRYTVDPAWQEPHFEKMLSDNAQLAMLYLEAGKRWGNEAFHRVGLETLDFMLRAMRHPEGGFVSALSAVDGDGVEGAYYLWSDEELAAILDKEQQLRVERDWRLHGSAEWSGRLLLPQEGSLNEVMSAQSVAANQRLRKVLLRARSERDLPRDTKRLAAWNALALSALSRVATEQPRYREAAVEVRDYLVGLWDGSQLWRMRDDRGEAVRAGGLEDYALVARALLQWGRVSDDTEARRTAGLLLKSAWKRFYRAEGWRLAPLVRGRSVIADDVTPSPVTVLVESTWQLQEGGGPTMGREASALLASPDRLLASPLSFASYLHPLQRLADAKEQADD